MSKMKQPYFDIALQVGGSHYPEVGGDLLQKFGDTVAKECAKIARENSDMTTAKAIELRFGIIRDGV
jgi:hypothetical protein